MGGVVQSEPVKVVNEITIGDTSLPKRPESIPKVLEGLNNSEKKEAHMSDKEYVNRLELEKYSTAKEMTVSLDALRNQIFTRMTLVTGIVITAISLVITLASTGVVYFLGNMIEKNVAVKIDASEKLMTGRIDNFVNGRTSTDKDINSKLDKLITAIPKGEITSEKSPVTK